MSHRGRGGAGTPHTPTDEEKWPNNEPVDGDSNYNRVQPTYDISISSRVQHRRAAAERWSDHDSHPTSTEEPTKHGEVETSFEEEEEDENEIQNDRASRRSESGTNSLEVMAPDEMAEVNAGRAGNPPDAPAAIYKDITQYLNMPQSKAAEALGIPTSTLSKRWKEAARNRKWPFRTISRLDKEIMTMLHNLPKQVEGLPQAEPPADLQHSLGILLRKRQEELRPIKIRMELKELGRANRDAQNET